MLYAHRKKASCDVAGRVSTRIHASECSDAIRLKWARIGQIRRLGGFVGCRTHSRRLDLGATEQLRP